jgi:opacity protein-like surface antigen
MIAPTFAKATVGKHPLTLVICLIALGASPMVSPSFAQAKPRPAAQRSRSVQINGYAMVGRFNLTAIDSFDAITGKTGGPIFGGGVRVGLPFGGLFVDVGAWRYHTEGERVFVSNGTVYPLNIPLEISLTPIELSAGWQFRFRRLPNFTPYVSGGLTSMQYNETSSFAIGTEDVDETFNGYHVSGGAEYRIMRWVGIAGEVGWTTVPDSIGESGVSAAFNDNDLGGTSVRFKITIGR